MQFVYQNGKRSWGAKLQENDIAFVINVLVESILPVFK